MKICRMRLQENKLLFVSLVWRWCSGSAVCSDCGQFVISKHYGNLPICQSCPLALNSQHHTTNYWSSPSTTGHPQYCPARNLSVALPPEEVWSITFIMIIIISLLCTMTWRLWLSPSCSYSQQPTLEISPRGRFWKGRELLTLPLIPLLLLSAVKGHRLSPLRLGEF